MNEFCLCCVVNHVARDDQVRVRAARDLSQYVATQSRELKSELFGEFMADLNKYVSQLVSSSNSNDVIGGIIAINELIEVDFRSHTIALARLAESLKIGLNSADPTVLSLAAQALGRLSRLPITLTYEICVGELKRALDSLKETQESRRHGAVLVLRAMASEAPTLFYGQMSNFVDVVWYAMRDSRQVVRMLAAETLGIALRLIGERDNAFQWNRYVYDLTTNGFRPASEPDVHGSLLALGELLTNAKDFMSGRTNEVCNLLQKYTQEKEKASQTIKQTVISLLPKAAASNPDAFVESSLQTFMDYLLGIITSPQPTKQGSSSSSSSTTSSTAAAGTQLIIGPGGLFGSSSASGGPTGFSSFGTFPSFYGSSTSYLLSHYGYANSLAYGSGSVVGSFSGASSGGSLFVSSPISPANQSGSSSQVASNSGVGPVSSQTTLPIQFFFPSDNADRSLALFATGELALALGARADRFKKEDLDKVIREIQDTLSRHNAPHLAPKMRSSAASVNDALACLTMLAQAVGPKIHQGTGMKALLDKIFSVKLSPQLIAALTALVDHIPSLVKDIQLRLVDKLSGVLRQKFTPNMKAASTSTSASSSSSTVVPSASVTSDLSASTTFGGTLTSKDGKKSLKTATSVKAIQPPLSVGGGAVGFLSTVDNSKEIGDTSNIGVVSSAIVPAGTPVTMPGSPAANVSGGSNTANKESSTVYAVVDEERTPELIALALNTLGSFNVIGYIQNIDEFLRDIAVNFLEEDNTTIRREAAVAVPQLLVRLCSNPKFVSTPISSFPLSEVIERLLLVGISDVDPAIRHTVLIHLEPTLDAFLAAPENLRCLFIALNDEVFAIRETAIAIIGRLSLRNPSDVMPSLRRTLIQLLTELEFGGDPRLKAESAQLLSVLIRNSRNLIEPYVKPILKALLPKLDPSQDPKVRQEILSAVGELAPAGQDMVASHMDTLIPLIVSYLADQTTIGRRELALRVLAQLTRYTSHVVDPLSRWPDLLHLLLAIAKTEKSKFVRRQVLRVLGTMGALDPYTFKMSAQPSSSQGALSVGVMESEEDDEDKMHRQLLKQLAAARAARGGPNGAAGGGNGGGGGPNAAQPNGAAAAAAIAANLNDPTFNAARLLNPSTASTSRRAAFSDPNSDTYYPYVAIKSLSTILWDQSLGAYHEKVVRSIVMITKECVGESKVQLFLPVILPPFLHLLGGAEKEFSVLLLNQISLLVSIAKGMPSVREYLIHVFHMVSDLWHSELLPSILGFIEEISSVMGDEFMVFLPLLVPKLLSVLDSPDSVEMCMRILRTLEWVGPSLDDYLHLVAPAIMTLVNQADSELLRIAAMQTIGRLCRVLNFSEYASRIIQPMARLLQTQVLSSEYKNAILCTLCHLVHQLGSDYAIFVPVMNRILNKRQITHATYEFLVSKVLKNQAILESELPALPEIQIPNISSAIPGAVGSTGSTASGSYSTTSKSSTHHHKKEKEKKSKSDKRDTKSSDIRSTTQVGDASAPSAATAAGATGGPSTVANQGNLTSRGEPTGAGAATSMLADSSAGHRGTISLASGVSLPAELKVNEANLRKAWAASSQSTRDDWDEWMRRFSVELVRESPQHALRFCLELAKEYFPLVRDVFTAAFVACWTALSRQARTEFTDNLRTALKSPHMPREILQQWLNVAEFMEQSRIDPIEIHKELGRLAFKCHAYAKALHYKELEFQKQNTPEAVEALITINTQLQQPEAAEGMLRYSQERMNLDLRESWYEKLHRWEDALLVHRSKRPKPTATSAPVGGLANLTGLASSASIAIPGANSGTGSLGAVSGAGAANSAGATGASSVGSAASAGVGSPTVSGISPANASAAGASTAGIGSTGVASTGGPLSSLPGAQAAAVASAMTTAVFWPAPTIPIYDHDPTNLMPGKTGSLSGAANNLPAFATNSALAMALNASSSATGRAGSVDGSIANEKEAAPNSTSSSSSSMGTSATSTSIGASESTIQNAIAASQKQQEVYNQSIVGEMRCLHSLGEWDRLLELSVENWKFEYKNRTSIAPWAASAAWHLHDWNAMATFLEELRDTNVESLMMKTVLQLQKAATPAEFEHVRFLIDKTRDAVDTEMTPLLAESYQRAYDALINVQLLAEMEDVIDFKLYPERRSVIRKVWRERLERCQRSVATWQRILAVRAIAEMEESTWLRFATLCRKTGALRQSHKVLTILMGTDPAKQPMAPLPTQRPSVTYQYILQLWTAGAREIAYQHLVKFESFLEMHRPTPLSLELGSSLAALGLTGWIAESSNSSDASTVSAAGGNAGVSGAASGSAGASNKSTQAGNNSSAAGSTTAANGSNAVQAITASGSNHVGHQSGANASKRHRVRRAGDGSTHLTVRLNAASPFALLTAKLEQNGVGAIGQRNKLAHTRRNNTHGHSGSASGNAEHLQSEFASPSELAAIGAPNDRASKMQARCALTLGLWQLDMHEHSLDSEKIDLIISNLGKALVCDPTWPKAWHVWATTNFEMATIYEKRLARHAARRKNMPAPLLASATSLHLRTAPSYAVTGGSSTSINPTGTNAASGVPPSATTNASAAAAARGVAKHGSLTSITNPGTNDPTNPGVGGSGPVPAPHISALRRGAAAGQGGSAAAILSSAGNTGSSTSLSSADAAAAAAAATAQVAHVQQHNSMTLDKERLFRHVDAAVKGFFRSIALSHGAQTLQDTLRLLTLWFKYGGDRLIEPVLQEGFNSVPIDTWLPVIPQIIARMDSSNLTVRRMVAELLSRIGKEHPQALVYPLVLTAKATNTTRQSMAHSMMNQMRQYDQLHYNTNASYSSLSGGAFGSGSGRSSRSTGGYGRQFVHADDDDDDNMGWAFSPGGGHDQILGSGFANMRGKNAQARARPAAHPYSTFATGEEGMFTHHQSHGAGAHQANGGMAMNAMGEFGLAGASAGGWNSSLFPSSTISSASGQANFLSLIDQALLISEELIRVAISDTEAWHECLEEASRAYFFDNNAAQMVSIVRPLHEALLQPKQHAMSSLNENGVVGGRSHTSMELSFRQAYSAPLNQAWGWCLKYLETGSTMCLNQAWDLYWYVYHAINKQQEKLVSLQLSAVSPRLLGLTQLSLAVPGTYQVGAAPITITGFHPIVSIIPSKQRPRKLRMTGSDGVHYSFLLKGHEDLRQDERVMQLFGLINNLLLANPQTANKHLRIQRFSVTPLSPNSGLIGWVPHCDTMNALIKEYRTTAEPKIPVDSETQILERQYPEYPQLMVVQKIEVFKLMTAKFDGKDLANIMWLKSPSSEVWLDRRTNYIRSLAVMSMAGYILGLGDRHPSNIMIDRYSGHVVHIDFGDCFETAMLREKHPEKVPFRLTRMVINAMEVSGIEGTFRTTCNQVLEVLRKNRDSLMAVLEAFVHDPLINWGLKTNANANAAANKDGNAANKDGGAENNGANKGTATSPAPDGVSNFSGSYSLRDTISSSGAFSAASHRFRDYNFQDDENADYAYRHSNGTTPSQQNQQANNNGGNNGGNNGNAPQRDKEAAGEKELNERALSVISRVHNKLTGRDFGDRRNQGRNPLTVPEQVHKLIQQATSTENLCQSFSGWCPWW